MGEYKTFNELWRDCVRCMFARLTGHTVVFGIDASKRYPERVRQLVDAALIGRTRPDQGTHADMYRFDKRAYADLRRLAHEEFHGSRPQAQEPTGRDAGAPDQDERRFADP